MSDYAAFLRSKAQLANGHGFDPVWMPDFLMDFQKVLVEWAVRRGRCAIFADCGMGKTPMQLVWAQNVVEKTGKPVLIGTPLAVSHQTLRESEKFGVECERRQDGGAPKTARVVVTNYERLHLFDSADFAGMVCDESSILKNFNGTRKGIITEFMRQMPYRLLCTATAAPNDYTELGTSSEALGEMGYMDMLSRFFKNDQNTTHASRTRWKMWGHSKWRFKGHSELPFWRWICSWARACRRPSDLGFDDGQFILPPLTEVEHVVETRKKREGMLFDVPAQNIREEREERRRTIEERCEQVAALVDHKAQALVWCHLNDEGDRLARMIPDAQQVKGADSDEKKEETLLAFQSGDLRVLVTKPKIGAWGLNLQGCSHITFFPDHSYESYYQGVRRCWRFGQQNEVKVDLVSTKGEQGIMANLQRKATQADRMFSSLVEQMHKGETITISRNFNTKEEVPQWLSTSK